MSWALWAASWVLVFFDSDCILLQSLMIWFHLFNRSFFCKSVFNTEANPSLSLFLTNKIPSIYLCSFSYLQTEISITDVCIILMWPFSFSFQKAQTGHSWEKRGSKLHIYSVMMITGVHWHCMNRWMNTRFYPFPSINRITKMANNWCTFCVWLKKTSVTNSYFGKYQCIIRVCVDIVQITSNSVFCGADTNPWAEQLWQADNRNLIGWDVPLSASTVFHLGSEAQFTDLGRKESCWILA